MAPEIAVRTEINLIKLIFYHTLVVLMMIACPSITEQARWFLESTAVEDPLLTHLAPGVIHFMTGRGQRALLVFACVSMCESVF